jgi:hypothetical protein
MDQIQVVQLPARGIPRAIASTLLAILHRTTAIERVYRQYTPTFLSCSELVTMEGTVVRVATGALKPAAEKLFTLLGDEYKRFKRVRD